MQLSRSSMSYQRRIVPDDEIIAVLHELAIPGEINKSWSTDFMSDALWCSRRFRTFNVVDDPRREVLAIEVDLNLSAS